MMAEVTTALSAVGIIICSCVVSGWASNFCFLYISPLFYVCNTFTINDQAEIDKERGMAVMLFHVEGSAESLVILQTLSLNPDCMTW